MAEIPKETEQHILEFQQAQGQLQLVMAQKAQVRVQLDDLEGALAELEKAHGKVYKSTGSILLESGKEALGKELGEKKETLLVRSQVLGKQEEKLRTRLTELRGKIEAAAKDIKGAG